MDFEKEVIKATRIVKLAAWGIIFICAIAIVAAYSEPNIFILLISLIGLILGVICLFKADSFYSNEKEYIPGKGFRFYRMTKEQKLKYFTYTIWGGLIYLAFSWIYNGHIPRNFIYMLSLLFFFHYYTKSRIKAHVQIDDALLYELEELNIIKSQEHVEAIYKDFSTWSSVNSGEKIILVTNKNLVCLIMENRENAVRIDIPLREINRLGIVGYGSRGKGLIFAIGTRDGKNVRIKFEGNSRIDSPEEFTRYFLNTLDKVLTGTYAQNIEGQNARPEIVTTANKALNHDQTLKMTETPRISIRTLDFNDNNASESDAQTVNAKSDSKPKRFLDL
ncbi:hypothetical protein ABE099_18090 [Paenibacillus turicensis]|uniref:hypothetical protein n=1 Tax=Paenibacillus turicensis TaxID=160487 RepID=UPI003D290CBF